MGASHICKNTFFLFPIPYSLFPVKCSLKAINFWLYSRIEMHPLLYLNSFALECYKKPGLSEVNVSMVGHLIQTQFL